MRIGCRKVCPENLRSLSLSGVAKPTSAFGWYSKDKDAMIEGYPLQATMDPASLWRCGLSSGGAGDEVYLCRKCATELGFIW